MLSSREPGEGALAEVRNRYGFRLALILIVFFDLVARIVEAGNILRVSFVGHTLCTDKGIAVFNMTEKRSAHWLDRFISAHSGANPH